MKKILRYIAAALLVAGIAFPVVANAARTSVDWVNQSGTSYIQPNFGFNGVDLLINGANHYINFNAVTGVNGYGIRDNAGVMEFKNSGGSWTGFGTGSGGSSGVASSSPWTSGQITQLGSDGTIHTVATSSLGLVTTDVAEGTNIYYTLTRGYNLLSGTTSLPNITTLANLSLPYSQVTGAPSAVTPGGASSTVQFNANGVFAGNTGMTYTGSVLNLLKKIIIGPSPTSPAINSDTGFVVQADNSNGQILTVNAAGTKGVTIDNSGTYPTIHSDYFSGSDPILHLSTYTDKDNGKALYVIPGGNVGINTASPVTALETKGTASSSALVVSSLSGIMRANGASTVTVAVAGTDYENPLLFSYPLLRSTNTISLGFGTTTANTWSQLQTFGAGFISNASSTVLGNFTVASGAVGTTTDQVGSAAHPACHISRDSGNGGYTYSWFVDAVMYVSTTSCE